MPNCQICARRARRDKNTAPLWDNILRTPHWDVVHAHNTSLPGWLVIVARRHFESVDAMTDDEAADFGQLLRDVSAALRAATGCTTTYVVQFAEHPEHPHVHFHVVPHVPEHPAASRGAKVFVHLNVPEEVRLSEQAMNAVALKVRQALAAPR